ncbi:MAG: hypothetical protein KC461_12705 [Dehalococcoidia bacterium]|nr:hypothetical protein [Dehalococcoidia bacterium]
MGGAVNAVRIDAADDNVWRLTLAALEASTATAPTLTIRCAKCGAQLGLAGVVPGHGPLFTAAWQVPLASPWRVNGRRLSEREARRYERSRAIEATESGEQVTDETHSTIALLRLPASCPQEYPTLLVRCARHGDAILDRAAVLDALDHHTGVLTAAVSYPLTEYEPPREDFGTLADTERTRRTFTIRPRPSTTTEPHDGL